MRYPEHGLRAHKQKIQNSYTIYKRIKDGSLSNNSNDF